MTKELINSDSPSPATLIEKALESNVGIDQLERLFALQERWEKQNAFKLFNAALSAAKSEIRPISKNKKVDYTSAKGRTNYTYEGLDDIDREIRPILELHGLSYRFETDQSGDSVKVTCIVSHSAGHVERTSLSAPYDQSGSKSRIQGIGSAVAYLMRYTLKAALGLVVTDDVSDTDGVAPISEDQFNELMTLISETKTDAQKFCAAFGVESVKNLQAARFDSAKNMLLKKKNGMVA